MIKVKLVYLLYAATLENLSVLILIFIGIPIIATIKDVCLITIMISYLYLGVIIIFIIIGVIILNVKMNYLSPFIRVSIGILMFYSEHYIYTIRLRLNRVVIIFSILLIIIYKITKLFYN